MHCLLVDPGDEAAERHDSIGHFLDVTETLGFPESCDGVDLGGVRFDASLGDYVP